MCYQTFKSVLIAFLFLWLNSCSGAPQPSGHNVTVPLNINETVTSTDTVAEPINLNNCGGSANVEQVSERSQTISVEGTAQLGVSIELAQASVAGKYVTSNTVRKSQTVIAPPGTNMKFVLLWTEQVNEGTVTANGYSGYATYHVSVPISVEQVSAEDLGCPNSSTDQPIAGNTLESPTQVVMPTATLLIIPTSTPSGPTIAASDTWSQDGIDVFLDQLRVNTDGISGYVVVSNQTGQSLMFDVDSRNFSLTDNLGNLGDLYLRNRIFDIQQILIAGDGASKLEAGEKMSIDMTFTGLNFGNSSVTYAVLAIKELSRATNVRWQIVIPH